MGNEIHSTALEVPLHLLVLGPKIWPPTYSERDHSIKPHQISSQWRKDFLLLLGLTTFATCALEYKANVFLPGSHRNIPRYVIERSDGITCVNYSSNFRECSEGGARRRMEHPPHRAFLIWGFENKDFKANKSNGHFPPISVIKYCKIGESGIRWMSRKIVERFSCCAENAYRRLMET